MGLPPAFDGVIYDTASISTLHALAAAREAAVPVCARTGCRAATSAALRVYCSEHAHSSVDKAVILLGLGHDGAAPRPERRATSGCGADALRDAIAARPRRLA